LFFLIAGVSPKIKVLDHNPRRCPVCGLSQAYYKRIDHYLNLFFIPVFRVKKGDPFIMCERCEKSVHEFETHSSTTPSGLIKTCGKCGKNIEPSFSYCPFCGTAV
jgi:rubrerythrin